jgi:hypothetical protein
MNLYPVTVIENFYENPDAIRKFALKQKYTFCHEIENIEYVYPGCRTKDLSYLDTLLFVRNWSRYFITLSMTICAGK